jgi:hypothetical protein
MWYRQHPVVDKESVRAWTAPKAGVVAIGSALGDVRMIDSGGNGTKIRILRNAATVYPSSGGHMTVPAGGSVPSTAATFSVATGDKVYFQVDVNGDAGWDAMYWAPTVTYLE